jgi:hypothetical protein
VAATARADPDDARRGCPVTRYSVTATLTYVVDLPDEDAVYQHADDDLLIGEVERAEVYVQYVQEVTP